MLTGLLLTLVFLGQGVRGHGSAEEERFLPPFTTNCLPLTIHNCPLTRFRIPRLAIYFRSPFTVYQLLPRLARPPVSPFTSVHRLAFTPSHDP